MADYGKLFVAEELRLDGSNFIEWYLRLREVLSNYDELYVLHETLGEKPKASASYNKRMAWLHRSKTHTKVNWLMSVFMNSDLAKQFKNLSAIESVTEIKKMFIAHVRIARFEGLDEFLSNKMEETDFLEQHLEKMYKIYYTLVNAWDMEMSDEFVIDGLLRSLPASFKNCVRDYVMERDSMTYPELVSRLRRVERNPLAKGVNNAEGIF